MERKGGLPWSAELSFLHWASSFGSILQTCWMAFARQAASGLSQLPIAVTLELCSAVMARCMVRIHLQFVIFCIGTYTCRSNCPQAVELSEDTICQRVLA